MDSYLKLTASQSSHRGLTVFVPSDCVQYVRKSFSDKQACMISFCGSDSGAVCLYWDIPPTFKAGGISVEFFQMSRDLP